MNTPRVLNLHHTKGKIPPGAVKIDRSTKWGNPFKIGPDGNRATVIRKYKEWIGTQHELLDQLEELRGKDLACWCHPNPCHGHFLVRIANPEECGTE